MTRGLSAFAAAVLAIVLSVPIAGARVQAQQGASVASAGPQRPQLLAQTPAGTLTVPDSVSVSGSPSTVAADTDGTVYVGLGQRGTGVNSDIAEFDAKGNFVRAFGAHLVGQNPLLAVGPDHNVYAWANSTFEPIREYSPGGTLVRTIAIPSSIVRLSDFELDGSGNIFATGYDNNGSSWKVFRFDPSGNETASFAVGAAGDELWSIAVGSAGTLWVVMQHGDVSVLVHVDAAGHDLKDAPYLGVVGGGALVRDIDYADGRLYAIGYGDPILGPPAIRGKVVLSTITPTGFVVAKVVGSELADYCCHDGYYSVAVAGNKIWATGLDTSTLLSRVSVFVMRPQVGELGSSAVVAPSQSSYATATCDGGGAGISFPTGATPLSVDLTGPPTLYFPRSGALCRVSFANVGTPCSAGNTAQPHALFQNGDRIGGPIRVTPDGVTVFAPTGQTRPIESGPVYAEWICTNPKTHQSATVFEQKGDFEFYDPSGTVVDARTGRAIADATVAIQLSPGAKAPFGVPSFGDIRPQVNPELTAPNGSFGWDVAPGRWRVKVVAFGYRPYVSPAYDVPPPVTGLKLQLRPDAAKQRYLIDPKGRVGPVTLGGKTRHTRGLKLRAVRGRIRAITVLSRRFQTELGIRLGSKQAAVNHAYPQSALQALKEKSAKIRNYRVNRATFRIRGGRVVGIVLG